jgi:hypothetical protein
MATRQNPFYQFRTPALAQGFNGMAAAMFPEMDQRAQSAAVENMAQADMANANAGKYREQTRGYRDVNNAMVTNPNSIAELILSGGVLKDDPIRKNPDYKERAPIDFTNILTQAPQPEPQSMFMPGMSAQEKMAAAIQEATIRKIDLDRMLKAAGMNEYQRRAASANPDMALPFAPFAGITSPNTQTALTTGRQDAISARDSNEAQALEGVRQSGANSRNKYSVDNKPVVAGNNQDVIVSEAQGKAMGITPNENGQYVTRGRATVGTGQDQRPGSAGGEVVNGRDKPASGKGGADKVTAVPVAASKRMESVIAKTLTDQGVAYTPEIMAGLLSEAGTTWQSNKNPDAAADSVLQRIRGGENVNGVSLNVEQRMLRSDKKTLTRGGSLKKDEQAIAGAKAAIGKGADRNAVIKRLKDNGIDPAGL